MKFAGDWARISPMRGKCRLNAANICLY